MLAVVCYGLLLILVQTTIVRITGGEQRARGLVTVASAIVAAGVCGPALGGIVADRLGTTAALQFVRPVCCWPH